MKFTVLAFDSFDHTRAIAILLLVVSSVSSIEQQQQRSALGAYFSKQLRRSGQLNKRSTDSIGDGNANLDGSALQVALPNSGSAEDVSNQNRPERSSASAERSGTGRNPKIQTRARNGARFLNMPRGRQMMLNGFAGGYGGAYGGNPCMPNCAPAAPMMMSPPMQMQQPVCATCVPSMGMMPPQPQIQMMPPQVQMMPMPSVQMQPICTTCPMVGAQPPMNIPQVCPMAVSGHPLNGICSWMTAPLVPDMSPCSYLQCVPTPPGEYCGRWQQKPCAPGTRFDPAAQVCVHDEFRQCGGPMFSQMQQMNVGYSAPMQMQPMPSAGACVICPPGYGK